MKNSQNRVCKDERHMTYSYYVVRFLFCLRFFDSIADLPRGFVNGSQNQTQDSATYQIADQS